MGMSGDLSDFALSSYHFDLPQELVAQQPAQKRGESRLMVMPARGAADPVPELTHAMFGDLPRFLPKGALLVANNSRVMHARLLGVRHTGGKVEFLLLTPLPLILAKAKPRKGTDGFFAEAEGLLRCGGKVNPGDRFSFAGGITVEILQNLPFGYRKVCLHWQEDLEKALLQNGHLPLPPYIRRPDNAEDVQRYQTVYSDPSKTGSVAAPTAGLHFTSDMPARLVGMGFEWAEVTLYVGYGTFSPVRCDDIRQHQMHQEYVEVSEETAAAVCRAKSEGRPIFAVGTTSTRALEGGYAACGGIQPFSGWTDIFIYPGKKLHVVDGMLTNFHLPESSLLMLLSALTGRERLLAAYAEAIRRKYRFFSYGDAMLVV